MLLLLPLLLQHQFIPTPRPINDQPPPSSTHPNHKTTTLFRFNYLRQITQLLLLGRGRFSHRGCSAHRTRAHESAGNL
jgi:hypothetical protein